MLRVLLLQLPLLEPDSASAGSNIPLAGGCLSAAARQTFARAGLPLDIGIVDAGIADHAGDQALLSLIAARRPDVLGMTLYLWNRERSTFLAEGLRQRCPGLRLAAGGPDAAALDPGHPFDFVCTGEGEEPFSRWLLNLAGSESVSHPSAAGWPDPWSSGDLAIVPGGSLLIETTRGCPCSCSYCFYGRAMGKPRMAASEAVCRTIARAQAQGARDAYILDPYFNARPDWRELAAAIGHSTGGRLPLHTELRLEPLQPADGRLLSDAGLASVEAGLQSVEPEALRAVRRSLDQKAFARGAGILLDAGIEVRTGLILGLPGDTLDGFSRSLDFVEDCGLLDNLEVYPLAVLPGTRLAEEAAGLGLEWMPKPPYWVSATPTMPTEALFEALALLEDRMGVDYHRPALVRLTAARGAFCSFIDSSAAAEALPASLANRVVVWHRVGNADRDRRLFALLNALRDANPYGLCTVLFDQPPPAKLAQGAISAGLFAAHPAERWQFFDASPLPASSLRLQCLCQSRADYERVAQEGLLHPLLRHHGGTAGFEDLPACASTSPGELADLYRGYEHFLTELPDWFQAICGTSAGQAP